MIIDLYTLISHEGESKEIIVPVEMPIFDCSMGSYPITEKSDVKFIFKNVGNKNIHLQSYICVTLAIPCARCLKEVSVKIELNSQRELNFGEENPEADEFLSDMAFIDGTTFDSEKYVYGEILENLPMKTLCSEDCKGICNVCGKNLNEGECDCNREVRDPRMAQFLDVFKKMNE